MAKNVRMEYRDAAFQEMAYSANGIAAIAGPAERIADAAGPGVEFEVWDNPGNDRPAAVAITRSYEARRNEARNRSLTRAIDAGR